MPKIETVGFTGTRDGMTEQQKVTVIKVLRKVGPIWTVHGDCVGADTDFHWIVKDLQAPGVHDRFKIRVRPCTHQTRAWNIGYDEIMPVKKPLERNVDIVSDADLVVGTPYGAEIRRSGTWHTLREARDRQSKPTVIVWPNGTATWENFDQ